MTHLRLILVALTASALLTSCGAFQSYDSRYPTVAQQDATDLAWGLPPRKSRGNPKLRMQYDARNDYMNKAAAPAPAVPQMTEPAPASSAPATAPAAPIPVVPSNLR